MEYARVARSSRDHAHGGVAGEGNEVGQQLVGLLLPAQELVQLHGRGLRHVAAAALGVQHAGGVILQRHKHLEEAVRRDHVDLHDRHGLGRVRRDGCVLGAGRE